MLEVLARFRSRKAEIGLSPRFRALFASVRTAFHRIGGKKTDSSSQLNHTSVRHWISTNPFAVLKGLSKSRTAAELQQAHSFWVNRETRRRLLLGSFILDMQQAVFFEQSSVLFPRWSNETTSAQASTLPFPCDNQLWECANIEQWAELAKPYHQANLSSAADSAVEGNMNSLDSFRSRLILAHLVIRRTSEGKDPDVALATFHKTLAEHTRPGQYASTEFDIHAYSAAQNSPLRDLLIVSGESWLFGKKLENEDDFHAAKFRLRGWVGSSKAQTALWHATALLRMVFNANAAVPPASEIGTQDREMKVPHEQWCVYIAALVCWACTVDVSPSEPSDSSTSLKSPATISRAASPAAPTPVSIGYPPIMDPIEADAQTRSFLQVTDVEDASNLSNALGATETAVAGQIKGLLEAVRTRKINGTLGGLLNEGAGVLYRLVEGRSRLSRF